MRASVRCSAAARRCGWLQPGLRSATGWGRPWSFLAGQQLVFAGLLLVLTLVLMPRYGLTGVGVAWLATACVLALVLAVTEPRWLTTGIGPHRP
ncbi:hypothetical protein [Kitasatospora sp. NPDC093679]|uniref:hypothetical protein n=1 Tax=Kitasatospora sp. NPDC093679 TaxID=3154983 RepID=UPI0034230785